VPHATTDVTSVHAQLRAILKEWTAEQHTRADLYDRLEAEHADLVDAFIAAQRRELVLQAIRMMTNELRRATVRRAVAADVSEARAAGIDLFAMELPASEVERKPLGLMVKPEVQFAADEYGRRKNENAVWEAVLRQIGRKLRGGQKVSDAYTPERLTDVFRTFGVEIAQVA
jgi:hypothetical protein